MSVQTTYRPVKGKPNMYVIEHDGEPVTTSFTTKPGTLGPPVEHAWYERQGRGYRLVIDRPCPYPYGG